MYICVFPSVNSIDFAIFFVKISQNFDKKKLLKKNFRKKKTLSSTINLLFLNAIYHT